MVSWSSDGITKPLVIYHKNCTDGHTAAWLIRKVFPDGEFIASYYDDPIPVTKDRDVIIVDFSYKKEIISEIQKSAKSFLLIDHHISAQRELQDVDNCLIEMEHSASLMIYNFFKDIKPELFSNRDLIPKYVSDKDLNKFELESSKEFNAFLSTIPMTFSKWDEIENDIIKNDYFAEMVESGTLILNIRDKILADICSHSFKSEIYVPQVGQTEVTVVNTSSYYAECAEFLTKNSDIAIAYFRREDKKYSYSLRSSNDKFDLSQIAKFYSGGGHKKAAGFLSSVDIFN